MSKHLTLLLNQYAERIVQQERMIAELRDELEQYEGASEALAKSRDEQVAEEDACHCPACSFESFMDNLGIPTQDPESDGARYLQGLDPEQALQMLLGAKQDQGGRSSAEQKAQAIRDAFKRAGINADVEVVRRKK